MARIPSQYQEIWETLKAHKYCLISCAESDKAKLKKAVIKRKDLDLWFKETTKHKYKLEINSKPAGMIEFRLVSAMARITEEDM